MDVAVRIEDIAPSLYHKNFYIFICVLCIGECFRYLCIIICCNFPYSKLVYLRKIYIPKWFSSLIFRSPSNYVFLILQSICLLERHLIARQQYLQFVLRLYNNQNRSVGICERQRKPRYQIPQGLKETIQMSNVHMHKHTRTL